MKNPPNVSQAVLSTLSADPKPSFKHKMYDLCIFLGKKTAGALQTVLPRIRRLEAFLYQAA
jgi:hypothetical protein